MKSIRNHQDTLEGLFDRHKANPGNLAKPAENAYYFAVSKNPRAFDRAMYAADIMEEYWLTPDQIIKILKGDYEPSMWVREDHPGMIAKAIESLAAADDDCYLVRDFYQPSQTTPTGHLDGEGTPFAVQDVFEHPESAAYIKPAWELGCGKVVQVYAPRILLRLSCRRAKRELPEISYRWARA